jgi:cyclic pyranopterin phosphate synthase
MKLTHLDEKSRAKMVDVGAKPETARTAVAQGFIHLSKEVRHLLEKQRLPKGDPFETARIAGIMAAKKTHELIPLCHPLLLSHINVDLKVTDTGVAITATVSCRGTTGVEMEALTAVSITALTIYDMCKAIDKDMVISDIRLIEKRGGKSGTYRRE